jgi:hypothetical protein
MARGWCVALLADRTDGAKKAEPTGVNMKRVDCNFSDLNTSSLIDAL